MKMQIDRHSLSLENSLSACQSAIFQTLNNA